MGGRKAEERWVFCPVCGHKTRIRVRGDTVLEHFPLYCPKCKQKPLINLKQQQITIISEPDA